MDDAHVRRAFDGAQVQRAVPRQSRQGPDRPVGRVRPADPDGLRRRSRARARRGRQGRRPDRPSRGDGRAARRHPARHDEHVDDDQRDGGLAVRALHRRRRRAGRRRGRPAGHDPERHHQGVPRARHVRLPARAVDAADRRHGRLRGDRGPALEPDQHLLLPPAGGGRDAGPGDRLRALQRDRRARRRAARASTPSSWARSSAASRSSSTPACASSRSTRSCARWARCGSGSAAIATASRIPSTCASATACRSTRSA